ncbi:MAG: hypothetical protein OH338_05035 [Candidatus Parvarchaeota archaeon]|nr:hypothetical protein [Candidatus Parvarchaeum tengchongense]
MKEEIEKYYFVLEMWKQKLGNSQKEIEKYKEAVKYESSYKLILNLLETLPESLIYNIHLCTKELLKSKFNRNV